MPGHARVPRRHVAAHAAIAFAIVFALAGCGQDPEAPVAAAPPADGEDIAAPTTGISPALANGPASAEGRVVTAIANARNLRVLQLGDAGAAGVDCRMGNCIEGNPILAGALLVDAAANAQAAAVLRDWFVDAPLAEPRCPAQYRHAIVFAAERLEYAVLLDYACGHYQVVVDGRIRGAGNVRDPDGEAALDGLLRRAASGDDEGEGGGDEAPGIEGGADEATSLTGT
jgi:hypothetical protein